MISLQTLITNPYVNRDVGNFRLAGAVFVLIPKLRAANGGGEYTAVLAGIIAKYAPFAQNLVTIETDLAFGRGFTMNREGVATEYLAFVRENNIRIKAKYQSDNAKLKQFHPNGMKPYKAGNKTTWVSLMDFYAAAATRNAADFPTQFVTDANAFAGRYTTSADTQSTRQTKTGLDRADRNSNRPLLEDALFTMLHLVIAYSHGNIGKIKSIINLKSLEPHPRATLLHIDNKAFALNTTINLLHENFDITYILFVRNTGLTDLKICLGETAETACTDAGQTLRVGKAHTYIMPVLGDMAKTYLNITNLGLTDNGAYEVIIRRE